jgi:2-oxoglutarate ferredoxin oxidoreductase subunit alpha
VCAWYPITPSTSVAESFERYANRFRTEKETGKKKFAIMQAEDELAAIGMVIGAAWNGARAFTATSGPGLSLMGEFLGLAYFGRDSGGAHRRANARVRSTGMPTRRARPDLMSAVRTSHGDRKHVG